MAAKRVVPISGLAALRSLAYPLGHQDPLCLYGWGNGFPAESTPVVIQESPVKALVQQLLVDRLRTLW